MCFANIESITNAHREILGILKARVDSWNSDSTLGDIFRDKLDYFKLYRPYVLTFPTLGSNFALTQAKHPLLVMMVTEFERTHKVECGTVESMFLLPTRRVEGLNTQLKELLRNTPRDHQDYNHLVWVTKTLNEREEELKKIAPPVTAEVASSPRSRSMTVSGASTKDKKKK